MDHPQVLGQREGSDFCVFPPGAKGVFFAGEWMENDGFHMDFPIQTSISR